MREVVEQLGAIELKIKDLAEKFAQLKEENQKLTEENTQLINDLDQLKRSKIHLESQLAEALSAAKVSKGESDDRKRLKKELGQYIKEIDKCILMMGEI